MKILHVRPSNHGPNLESWKTHMAMPTWDGKLFYFYDIDFACGFPFSEIKKNLQKLYKVPCTFVMSVKEVEM